MFIETRKRKHTITKVVFGLTALVIIDAAALGSYTFFTFQQVNNLQKQTETLKTTADKAIAAKEAKKKEPVYITLPEASPIRAIVDDYSLQSSVWAIVNKTHPISTDYVPADLKIPDVATRTDKSDEERSVRTIIEEPLKTMFAAAATDGYSLIIGSGYRSATLQSVYFNSSAASIGETAANLAIARPGESEHQTGLAVDLSTESRVCYLDNCFAETVDGQWLVNNSYKYGFILRYPADKTAITGYQYESWHFRYVGIDLATALHDSGLTLEEAWPYLETALATLKDNGAL